MWELEAGNAEEMEWQVGHVKQRGALLLLNQQLMTHTGWIKLYLWYRWRMVTIRSVLHKENLNRRTVGHEESVVAEKLKASALLAKESQEYEKALAILNEAISLNPTDRLLYGHRSTVLLRLGRNLECQQDAQKCLELDKLSQMPLLSEDHQELRSQEYRDIRSRSPSSSPRSSPGLGPLPTRLS